MSETLKKYKDYVGLIVFFIPLIFGIVKYTNTYMDMPDQINELQDNIKELKAAKDAQKEKDRKQDSINVVQSQFLEQDYTAIEQLKTQIR